MKRIIASFIVVVMLIGSCAVFNNVKATDEIENEVNKQENLLNEVINSINPEEINEIIETVNENVENIRKELTEEIIALRENALNKLAEIEEEYGIDLTEYKNRIADAVETYQTQEDYTKEQLAAEIQGIYNDLLTEIDYNDVKEKIIENIGKTYAAVREYAESQAQEVRDNVKKGFEELKKAYPELEDIEDIDELIDIVYNKIGEYEDAVLEMIEAYQEDPKGTIKDLTAKVQEKISELRNEADKTLKKVRDYVVDGKEMEFDTLEGESQAFDKTNSSSLAFRFDIYYRVFKIFGRVFVDDELVGEEYYTSKKGSTIITLSQDYLKNLEDGEHTLKIALGKNKEFGEAKSSFTVTGGNTTNGAKESTSPKTGDNITLYIALLGLATLGIVTTIKK